MPELHNAYLTYECSRRKSPFVGVSGYDDVWEILSTVKMGLQGDRSFLRFKTGAGRAIKKKLLERESCDEWNDNDRHHSDGGKSEMESYEERLYEEQTYEKQTYEKYSYEKFDMKNSQ